MSDVPDNIKSQFPVEIDLGISPTAVGETIPSDTKSGKSKVKKAKPYYPSLYIPSTGQDLSAIPQSGYALIYFERRKVSIENSSEGDDRHSAELEIQEICLPASSSEDSGDLMDAAKSVAKGMGIETGG